MECRSKIVDKESAGVYHCYNRCVQQAFLCGFDNQTGKDYSYRRHWITRRLKELSGIFGMEILAYAAMQNHMHIVVRTRPDVVATWSDEEVAQRWGRLYPGERDENGQPRPPDARWLADLMSDPKRLNTYRDRLRDLSWLMRSLNEWVATAVNREMRKDGRFWQGRYKCQRLVDQGSMLACMVYVDLNPSRAKNSRGVKDEYFTSLFQRVVAEKGRKRLQKAESIPEPKAAQQVWIHKEKVRARRADWLAPFGKECGSGAALQGVELNTYLKLVEWTRTNIVKENQELPKELASLVEDFDLDAEEWLANVKAFGGLFHRIVGRFEAILERARKKGMNWMWGKEGSQKLYRKPTPASG